MLSYPSHGIFYYYFLFAFFFINTVDVRSAECEGKRSAGCRL